MTRIKFNSEEARKVRKKETSRLWYLRNRELCLKRTKEWRIENPDAVTFTARKWRKDNREKVNAQSIKSYYNNHEEAKKRHREWRERNLEQVKAYAARHRRKPETREWYKAYNRKHTDKRVCRSATGHAIRDGKLKRGLCHCGLVGEAHHENYTKPLEIIWLCRPHHAEHHRRNHGER